MFGRLVGNRLWICSLCFWLLSACISLASRAAFGASWAAFWASGAAFGASWDRLGRPGQLTESSFELIGVAVGELCSNKRTLVLSTGLGTVKYRPPGRRQAPPKMEPKSALGAALGLSGPSWGRLGPSQAAKRKSIEKTLDFPC